MKPGETMIGSGQMSLYLKQGLGKKPFQGNVFVTNQRACFKISMMPGDPDMNLPLDRCDIFRNVHGSLCAAVVVVVRPFLAHIPQTGQRAGHKFTANHDLPLEEIKGFSVGKIALFTAVTIHSKDGKEYPLTGFPAKKLQDWLRPLPGPHPADGPAGRAQVHRQPR